MDGCGRESTGLWVLVRQLRHAMLAAEPDLWVWDRPQMCSLLLVLEGVLPRKEAL